MKKNKQTKKKTRVHILFRGIHIFLIVLVGRILLHNCMDKLKNRKINGNQQWHFHGVALHPLFPDNSNNLIYRLRFVRHSTERSSTQTCSRQQNIATIIGKILNKNLKVLRSRNFKNLIVFRPIKFTRKSSIEHVPPVVLRRKLFIKQV